MLKKIINYFKESHIVDQMWKLDLALRMSKNELKHGIITNEEFEDFCDEYTDKMIDLMERRERLWV